MSIPKTIHYCWFGRNPKPKLAEKCIKSWKKYCPDYEIIEWNEDNYNIDSAPLYVRQAYEEKKWAFMTDYIRLQVVYENGGIYMDTDVELKKSIDFLLNNQAYFGFEGGKFINTGIGFGAEKETLILKEMMDDYADIPFIKENGSIDSTPCPRRNTEVFLRHGLKQNDKRQILDGGILVLPTICLCPIDFETKLKNNSLETISIHWFDASWQTKEERTFCEQSARKQRKEYFISVIKEKLKAFLGDKRYLNLKKLLGRGTEENADD